MANDDQTTTIPGSVAPAPVPLRPTSPGVFVPTPDVGGNVPQAAQPSRTPQQANAIPALPRWPPQLQDPNRSPYMRAQDRPFRDIGTDWWPVRGSLNNPGYTDPMLPGYGESLSILQGAGRAVPYMSDYVGQPYARMAAFANQYMPLLDMFTKGQFSKSFFATREGNMRMMEDEMILNGETALRRHAEQLYGLKQIIQTWQEGGYGEGEQAEQKAKDDLRAMLLQTGHKFLLGTLDNKGIVAVGKHLEWEDKLFRDTYAGVASISKSSGKDTGSAGVLADEGGEGAGVTRQETLPKHPNVAGGAAPGATAEHLVTPALNAQDAAIQKTYGADHGGLTRSGLEAAQDRASGLPVDEKTWNRNDRGAVEGASRELNRQYNEILRQKGKLAADKLNDLRERNPKLADTLDDVGNYGSDFNKLPTGERAVLEPMLHSLYPDYRPQNYSIIGDFASPKGTTNRTLQRAYELPQIFANLMKALKDAHSESGPTWQHTLGAWRANLAGDPKYHNVYTALRDMANTFNSIQTLTGVPRVTTVHDIVASMNPNSTARDLLSQVHQDMTVAWSVIGGYQSTYDQYTHGQRGLLPGLTADNVGQWSSMLRINPQTGQVPTDATPEFLGLGLPPVAIKNVPPEFRYEPLTETTIRLGLQYVKENLNKPEKAEKIKEIMGRIGPMMQKNAPWNIPLSELQPNAR